MDTPEIVDEQVVSLCLFRFSRWRDRAWAFAQMGFSRRAFRKLPGTGFVKMMGAGTGEGFTPLPDPGVVAVLATWPDLAIARAQTGEFGVYGRYRARASEVLALYMTPVSARGVWSGRAPFRPGPSSPGPIAALTRATIRPRKLLKFWGRTPEISTRIGADANVIFKIGVGEIPLLHQVTFSIWPNAASMARFAREGGPHAEAIRAVRTEGWFSEELYARFTIRAHSGSWGGIDPLSPGHPAVAAK